MSRVLYRNSLDKLNVVTAKARTRPLAALGCHSQAIQQEPSVVLPLIRFNPRRSFGSREFSSRISTWTIYLARRAQRLADRRRVYSSVYCPRMTLLENSRDVHSLDLICSFLRSFFWILAKNIFEHTRSSIYAEYPYHVDSFCANGKSRK